MREYKLDVLLNTRGVSTEPAVKEYIIKADHYDMSDKGCYLFYVPNSSTNSKWLRVASFPIRSTIIASVKNIEDERS